MSKQQFPVIDSQTTTEKMAETKGYKTIEMATCFFSLLIVYVWCESVVLMRQSLKMQPA